MVESDNNSVQFVCDRGEPVCYANQIQSCAVYLINLGMHSLGLKYNENLLYFIKCFMENILPNFSKEQVRNISLFCESSLNMVNQAIITKCGADTQFGK